MKKSKVFVAVILIAGLCYGLFRLFAFRFAEGDIYPAYSSLRVDGLGTKALHDSFAELMPVERNLRPLSRITPDGATTIIMAGVRTGELQPASSMEDLKTLVHGGDRLIVAFLPIEEKVRPDSTPRKAKASPTGTPAGKETPSPEKAARLKRVEARRNEENEAGEEPEKYAGWFESWGMNSGFTPNAPLFATPAIPDLEPRISLHTGLYFDGTETPWKTWYKSGGKPVVIGRSFGRGTVVFVADSYLLSNEALSKERAPRFLSLLAGNAKRIIFDETHLGVTESPGIATLVRKYRLHGMVAALLVVALLFVWSNAVPFVPPAESSGGRREGIEGRDASAGFVSLLKRNIPPGELVPACVAEWRRSFMHRVKPAALAHVEALAGDGGKPVKSFQTIAQFLNQKK